MRNADDEAGLGEPEDSLASLEARGFDPPAGSHKGGKDEHIRQKAESTKST